MVVPMQHLWWPRCRIVKLVRALRKGWIKRDRQVAPQEPATYLMWDDDLQTEDKTLAGGTPIYSDTAPPTPNLLLLIFSSDPWTCICTLNRLSPASARHTTHGML